MRSIASRVPASFPPEAGGCRKSDSPRKPSRVGLPLLFLVLAAIIPAPAPGAGDLLHLPVLCPFRAMTGLPCPGCGMTRSLVCLAHGRVAESWAFHPLGGAAFVALVVFAAIRLFRFRVSFPPRVASATGWTVTAFLMLVWAARLLQWLPYPP